MRTRKTELPLLLVPAGFLILSVVMMRIRGPYNQGLNFDPEYEYLFSFINLATGHPSYFVHHPGTPLQIFGAAIVFLQWLVTAPFSGWPSLAVEVISHDVSYLRAVNIALVIVLAAVTFLAGRRVYQLTGSALAAAVAQFSPLFSLPALESLGRVAPELAEVIIGMALLIPLAPLLVGLEPRAASRNPRLAIIAGILVGCGIATKINFASLLLLVFLFSGLRRRLQFLGAAGVTVAALLTPIATSLPQLVDWFVNIIMHVGRYGRGPVGLPGFAQYSHNLRTMLSDEPFLYYFLAYYVIVLSALYIAAGRARDERTRAVRAALLVGVAIMLLHTAVTAKQFYYHYNLPARALKIALIVAGVWLGYEGLRYSYFRLLWYRDWKTEYHEHLAELDVRRRELTGCRMIGFFRSTAPTFAFALGNEASRATQKAALEQLYPGQIHYWAFDGRFLNWEYRPVRAQVERMVAAGQCVVIEGEVANRYLVTGFQLQPLYLPRQPIHGAEGIWRLTLDNSQASLIAAAEAPEFGKTMEAEDFTAASATASGGLLAAASGPAFAEYQISVNGAGRYAVRLRYASTGGEVLRVLLNGEQITATACERSTGGTDAAHLMWQEIGSFPFRKGRNLLRLESAGPFPRLDKIAIIPLR